MNLHSPAHSATATPAEPTADGADERQMQVGALCWRQTRKGRKVLLITSRDTGRWIIPKGWPIASLGPAGSAKLEAWEEAGVLGRVNPVPLGSYDYDKIRAKGSIVPCRVQVHALEVQELADSYPECTQRRRRWFTPAKAAGRVAEPELAALLLAQASESA